MLYKSSEWNTLKYQKINIRQLEGGRGYCDKVVYIKGNACVKNKKEVYDERWIKSL